MSSLDFPGLCDVGVVCGWNGWASGFSGLCPHSGLAFSVARSPDSSSLVGLGFVGSWDVGGFSNLLIFVTLFEV